MKLFYFVLLSIFMLSARPFESMGQGHPKAELVIKKLPTNAQSSDGVIEVSEKSNQSCSFILATPNNGTLILKGTKVSFSGLARGSYVMLIVSNTGKEELNFEL